MVLVHLDSAASGFVELEIGNSVESLLRLLDSQRELFHSQVDQLQKFFVTQCKLTGLNPLPQEMAAGALSIKIGQKPRDLLNAKTIKYMGSVFSIKDTIGKKETREISIRCGVTVTQVKEYFMGQRSRVRKLVRLSREKATRSDASKASSDGGSFNSDQILASKEPPMNSVDVRVAGECTQVPGNSVYHNNGECLQVPGNSGNLNIAQVGQQEPLNSTDLKSVDEVPLYSPQDETIPGVDSDDKKFLANIFNLMRKEETFTGQVKLMEWVLQIHNSAVLHWFLTKGGLTILATWLSEAALEEQTTVLLVFFKVLFHLPVHKALPIQISAILQTVSRLRFYRMSDISNRARILLSRWSKLSVRSQDLKKPSRMNPNDAQKEMLQRQRIAEILSNDSWQSKIDIPEEILFLHASTESSRKSEPRKGQKLLSESCDESSEKHYQSVSSSKTKERRKVLLVEQPNCKPVQVARNLLSSHSRPMSADDIQKAKMRAIFMQHKHGKADASTSESAPQKSEDHKTSPASRISQLHHLRRDDHKKSSVPTAETSAQKPEILINSKPNSASREQLWETVKINQHRWQAPTEIRGNSLLGVGVGEKSKEVEVQTQRSRREKEAFYPSVKAIPPNPKEPWDPEMDFDNSLPPEIPIEQPTEPAVAAGSSCSATTLVAPPSSNGATEPDLELLAVLLKNPDLVFALTSGQGRSLSNHETVALLDALKKSGVGLPGFLNRPADGSTEPTVEPKLAYLPSPTPSSEAARPHFYGGRGAPLPTLTPQILSPAPVHVAVTSRAPVFGLQTTQAPATVLSMHQLATVTTNSAPQQLPTLNFPPMPHQTPAPIYPLQHTPNPQTISPLMHHPLANASQQEPFGHRASSIPSQYALLPTPLRPQPPLLDPQSLQHKIPTWLPGTASVVRRDLTPDSRIVGRTGSNSHFYANQVNYNMHPNGTMRPSFLHPGQDVERSGVLNGPELEEWSPEGSPIRAPEFRSSRNFPGQRRELGRDHRPEWPNSRQWNPGHWDRHPPGSSRRWHRDGDGDGDRRR